MKKIDKTILYLKNFIYEYTDFGENIPKTVVVLGSGLGTFKESLKIHLEIPYNEIPYFKESKVKGHGNCLIIGETKDGIPIMAMNGRYHFYEGFTMQDIAYPFKVFKGLGVKNIILSAAVGSTSKDVPPGTIMAITDYIKFFDESPLMGDNDEDFTPRFPDMTMPYSYDVIKDELSTYVQTELGVTIPTGTYAFMPGPQYETPAEVKALNMLGASVVGMSTVPETIVSHACGMDVFAYAVISNYAAGVTSQKLNHEEVIENGKKVSSTFEKIINKTIEIINNKK